VVMATKHAVVGGDREGRNPWADREFLPAAWHVRVPSILLFMSKRTRRFLCISVMADRGFLPAAWRVIDSKSS
jgi:hypothetical protein